VEIIMEKMDAPLPLIKVGEAVDKFNARK